jgi:hypothetical protein
MKPLTDKASLTRAVLIVTRLACRRFCRQLWIFAFLFFFVLGVLRLWSYAVGHRTKAERAGR